MCHQQCLGSCQKSFYKLKEKDQVTFHSPAEDWVLPAASTKRAGGESLQWIPGRICIWSVRKTFNSPELETMRTSRSPMTVMTANGEVRTNTEATVHVKQLDLLVTVMLLQETPAVLSLGKLCEDHGYTYHWSSGQKPHLTKELIAIYQTMCQ